MRFIKNRVATSDRVFERNGEVNNMVKLELTENQIHKILNAIDTFANLHEACGTGLLELQQTKDSIEAQWQCQTPS